jgi:hypothetical protein
MTKTVVVVTAAHAEIVVVVVAEAEANISENKDSGGGVDGDGSGKVGISCGGGDGGQQRRWRPKQGQQLQWRWQLLRRRQTTTETARAGNIQQNAAGGIGCCRDSSCGRGNCCSAAAVAGRGGGAVEWTKMRAAATATTVVVNLYPFSPLPWWETMREKVGLLTKIGDVELFYVCDSQTLILWVLVNHVDPSTKTQFKWRPNTYVTGLAKMKCICDGFNKMLVNHKHKINFGNTPLGTLHFKRIRLWLCWIAHKYTITHKTVFLPCKDFSLFCVFFCLKTSFVGEYTDKHFKMTRFFFVYP